MISAIFRTNLKQYSDFSESVSFSEEFQTSRLNKLLKKLLSEKYEVSNENFVFYIKNKILTNSIKEFMNYNDIKNAEEIDEILFDLPPKFPDKEYECKFEETIMDLKIKNNFIAAACYDVQVFDINNLSEPCIFIESEGSDINYQNIEWIDYDSHDQSGTIVVGGTYGLITMFNVNMKNKAYKSLIELKGTKHNITGFNLTSNKEFLASVNHIGNIDIWDTDYRVNSSTDTKSAPLPKKKKGTSLPTKSSLYTIPAGKAREQIVDISWCNNRTDRIMSGETDATLSLWSVGENCCKNLCQKKLEKLHFKSLDCSKLNDLAVVGLANNSLKLYNSRSNSLELVSTIREQSQPTRVLWHPEYESYFFSSGCKNEFLKLWDSRFLGRYVKVVMNFDVKSPQIYGLDVDSNYIAASDWRTLKVLA